MRRTSRDTLPSPKPAPSATLPSVPRRFHRPSNLTLSISTYRPEAEAEAGPSSPTASSRHRATNSEPAVMSPSTRSSPSIYPRDDQSYLVFSPVESTTPSTPPLTGTSASDDAATPVEPLSAPPHITSAALKATPSFRSTASVGTRQRNRSAALAALEGRTPVKRSASVKRNFMSMSDDEDDEDDSAAIGKQLLGVLNEEEDIVFPDANKLHPAEVISKENSRESKRTSISAESKRNRRSTLDSLLSPLTNFIDFRDDEPTSRSWRSFVELA